MYRHIVHLIPLPFLSTNPIGIFQTFSTTCMLAKVCSMLDLYVDLFIRYIIFRHIVYFYVLLRAVNLIEFITS